MENIELIDRLRTIAQELDDLSTLHALNSEDADDPAASLMRVTSSALEYDAEQLRHISSLIDKAN
jgi:hypothetical protein